MSKHETLRAWLSAGRGEPLSQEVSRALDAHVRALPWVGSAIDWARMPASSRLGLDATPEAMVSWAKSTRLGRHRWLAVWYSLEAGGIVVPLEDGIAGLDELYWDAPGLRFCFGADSASGEATPVLSDFLQYGSGDTLIAAV
jgi:hypothetical protein